MPVREKQQEHHWCKERQRSGESMPDEIADEATLRAWDPVYFSGGWSMEKERGLPGFLM